MKKRTLAYILIFFLLIPISCNLPFSQQDPTAPLVFPTPETIFPSRPPTTPLPGEPTATIPPLITDTPTITPRIWPPPYFGSPGPTQVTPVPSPAPVFHDPDSINFVLLGSDEWTSSYRTDVIIVVNIQPEYGLVTLISIPRDLYVYIPGYKMQRINAAYYHGEISPYPGAGPGMIKDTILYNFGIEIDYYILVDFNGFINLIDTVGGLDVPVACNYTDWRIKNPKKDPEDEDNWRLYTVKTGLVHMDGDLALWYARARKKSSDFDRNRRQQEVIRALYSQALSLGWITKVPDLYAELSKSVSTDFTLADALELAPKIYDLRSAQVRSFYIDSRVVDPWKSPTGAAVQIPDHAAMYALIQETLSPPTLIETTHTQLVVEVWNGTAKSDLDILAAERLHYAGFDTQINISDRLDYSQTLLFDFTTEQDPETQAALLSLYGLDTAMLISFPDPDYPFDYRIVVGADFNPCFQPAKIDR